MKRVHSSHIPGMLPPHWILAGLALGLSWCGYGGGAESDLASYRQKYEKAMETETLTHGVTVMDTTQQYANALEALLKTVKAKGDLDKTKMVMAEMERFATQKDMPAAPSGLVDLDSLQSAYKKRMQSLAVERARRIVSLASQYDKALGRLQSDLVKADRVNDATQVQEERKRLASDPDYLAARELLTAAPQETAATPPAHRKEDDPTPLAPTNLLVNPGNEMPMDNGRIPGWQAVKGNAWGQRDSEPPPKEGRCYFFAGPVGHAELQQTVDLKAYRSMIAKGQLRLRFQGYTSSWSKPLDTSRILVEYLDSQRQKVLDSFDSGPRTSRLTWEEISDTRVPPKNAYYVRISLISDRHDGTQNDGYFDDLSLTPVPLD